MSVSTSIILPNTAVIPNTTLEQDGRTVLRLWRRWGGDQYPDELRRGSAGDNEELFDVSQWHGVTVEGGRVTRLRWYGRFLSGSIPAEIASLSALISLNISGNYYLCGTLPSELGNLTSLTELFLDTNSFHGSIPRTFANLTDLTSLSLIHNKFNNGNPQKILIFSNKERVQDYLYTTLRRPTVRYVITCVTVTNFRPHWRAIHPFFTFLANNEDITTVVLSYLGEQEVQEYSKQEYSKRKSKFKDDPCMF